MGSVMRLEFSDYIWDIPSAIKKDDTDEPGLLLGTIEYRLVINTISGA